MSTRCKRSRKRAGRRRALPAVLSRVIRSLESGRCPAFVVRDDRRRTIKPVLPVDPGLRTDSSHRDVTPNAHPTA